MSYKNTISVGSYNVISTGSVIGAVGEPINFIIEDLKISFYFLDDLENVEQKVDSKVTDDKKGIIINLINFNNPLGTGNTKPIRIGTIDNKGLFMNYRVFGMEGAGHLLSYTWLLSNTND